MKKQIIMMLLFCMCMQNVVFGEFSLKYPDESETEFVTMDSIETTVDTEDIKGPSWMVYQGNSVNPCRFYNYNPIIFYPEKHPVLAPLLVKNKTVLAYLSLGDIGASDYCYKETKSRQLLLGKNPEEPKRFIIDIRNPKWEELILNKIIPEILEGGFGGFCFCNLDAPLNLEQQNPEKYMGMTEAAICLLAKIKEYYGTCTIMLDMSGLLHIGTEVLTYADMLFYEHLFTQKQCGTLILTGAQSYLINAQKLQALAQTKPGLQVYTLDFWPAKEKTVVKNIYKKQRSYGFIPYVAENLGQLSLEPQ